MINVKRDEPRRHGNRVRATQGGSVWKRGIGWPVSVDNATVDSPLRRLVRLTLTGLVCALAVVAVGRISERVVMGQDDASARQRIERDVRGAFDVMSRGLQTIARSVAAPEALVAAARDDEGSARTLFEAA